MSPISPKSTCTALGNAAMVLDGRSFMEFATGHVAGAVQHLAQQVYTAVAKGISAHSVARQFQKTNAQ